MIRKQSDKKFHEAIDEYTTKEGSHKVRTYSKLAVFLQIVKEQEDPIATFFCHLNTSGNYISL